MPSHKKAKPETRLRNWSYSRILPRSRTQHCKISPGVFQISLHTSDQRCRITTAIRTVAQHMLKWISARSGRNRRLERKGISIRGYC
ncbi:hypothetical protein TNCV_1737051 [Trichonephila clavipes]|nr:hypothetical protein TNCV_1737051 [Trichonephila clavipes]